MSDGSVAQRLTALEARATALEAVNAQRVDEVLPPPDPERADALAMALQGARTRQPLVPTAPGLPDLGPAPAVRLRT